MTGRADVGRDARFVDPDDVVPAPLDQVMGNGGPDDAALPDDHDLRALVELRHYYSSPSKNSVPPRLTGLPVRRRPSGLAQTGAGAAGPSRRGARSEEHTSELQSLMRISYAVFCLKKKNKTK